MLWVEAPGWIPTLYIYARSAIAGYGFRGIFMNTADEIPENDR
jgi:hypothetical protein